MNIGGVNAYDKALSLTYEQYIKNDDNKCRCKEKQLEVKSEEIEKIKDLQKWVEGKIIEVYDKDKPAHETLKDIDDIMEEAYQNFFGEEKKVTKTARKPFMEETTLELIIKRDELWKKVRDEGKKMGYGWGDRLRKQRKRVSQKA